MMPHRFVVPMPTPCIVASIGLVFFCPYKADEYHGQGVLPSELEFNNYNQQNSAIIMHNISVKLEFTR